MEESRMKPSWRLLVGILVWFAAAYSALAHWPDQPPHQIAELGALKLEGGGIIKNLKMSYVVSICALIVPAICGLMEPLQGIDFEVSNR
jgi:hypothetical protein